MRVDGIVNKSGTVDSSFSQVLQFVVGLGAMHNAINHQTKPNHHHHRVATYNIDERAQYLPVLPMQYKQWE
jgi:hypothetical protein